MKKKSLSLLLAIMMITSMLFGCGHVNDEEAIEPTPAPEEIEIEETPVINEETEENIKVKPSPEIEVPETPEQQVLSTEFDLSSVPEFAGSSYIAVNGNVPYFTKEDLTTESFEIYTALDYLGRCGTAYANIGIDLMPTEERGGIGQVKPSGWHTIKYDCVDGKYLYNRCHLIGYQLSGENANTKNLITGTRYLNIEGMLPFENMVADYVKETYNHVLYRVTPIFEGGNLVSNGVLMEGYSVEDNGAGICFCVYAYNAQPGVSIDYATGESYSEGSINGGSGNLHQDSDTQEEITPPVVVNPGADYIININTKKFHVPSCHSVKQMNEENKQYYTGLYQDLIAQGYEPCKNCLG